VCTFKQCVAVYCVLWNVSLFLLYEHITNVFCTALYTALIIHNKMFGKWKICYSNSRCCTCQYITLISQRRNVKTHTD